MPTSSFRALRWMKKYLRYVDYIAAASLYLKDNYLLEEPLEPKHFKSRILGHWGTVPGISLVYANLNYLIHKHKASIMLVTGPGHGAPANLANLFAEKTLGDVYKDYPRNRKGMEAIIHDFSWPHTPFPSHVTPTVPGSILEGGELGYSLSTAFGSVMDNPDLISAVIVGDGEAETGPVATAWHSTKFINPVRDGAVLPIVHINGYKISNPTLFGTMSDLELRQLFQGYGWDPIIVSGKTRLEAQTLSAFERAYKKIRKIQEAARAGKKVYKPKWPVILMRSPKGWKGIHRFHKKDIEGSFRSHGIPLGNPANNPSELEAIERWLTSYKFNKLIDEKGQPKADVVKYVPTGKLRMGANKHAVGGNFYKKLKLPALSNYGLKFKDRGSVEASSMKVGAQMLRDVIKKNGDNFRIYCPDELESNKLGAIFEATNRAYVWPTRKNDEHYARDGRAMEMLSEHTLQGWMQGYLLTGRHGMFVTYEAFGGVISSMVDQYAKFLKQALRVSWRKPVPSAIYLLSSVGWRQDHNGYSHQNPSFVSGVLQKHGEFAQVYYPADANALLAAYEEAFKQPNKIVVIVAGKRNLPQWQSLKEAREQAKRGLGIWEWVGGKEGTKKPDVVLASAGDYITQEAIMAVKICREMVPEMKIRYVNVSEVTSVCLGDNCTCKKGQHCLNKKGLAHYFTKDKPVVFSYHGYVNDVEQILWPLTDSTRWSLHGYREEGSTTTPFDMKVRNGVSCYHLAMDMITQAAKHNKKIARKKASLIKKLNAQIRSHQRYIKQEGDDPERVSKMAW